MYSICMETSTKTAPAWMTAEEAKFFDVGVSIGERRGEAAMQIFLKRAVAALVAAGWKIYAQTGSTYFVTPAGKKIRVSDHEVPATAERRHEGKFRGGADDEYVVKASRAAGDKSPEEFAAWILECETDE